VRDPRPGPISHTVGQELSAACRREIEDDSRHRGLSCPRPVLPDHRAGLEGLVDGGHFFDLLAEDVVFEFIITVPDYPRQVVGRDNLIELYRGYGSTFFLDRCHDLRVHRSEATSTVVLEYASQGKVVATGGPYSNRYISVITLTDRKISHWRDYLNPLRVITALNAER
jgi:ketosteroid isomerase-like protein